MPITTNFSKAKVGIGFLISNLGVNQLAYSIINNSNDYLKDNVDTDIIVFYQNIIKSWRTPLFATMNITEVYTYPGFGVATTLSTAEKLLACPGPKKKFFYVWDLEWLRDTTNRRYEVFAAVYCDPKLQLLARSHEHAKRIEDAWNRPVRAVIENCDIRNLLAIVTSNETNSSILSNRIR